MAASSRSLWHSVGSTAGTKVLVMGISGVLGLINTKLIIQHFGTDAYAQYGLLTSFPNLIPFAQLGMAAVVINAVASAGDPRHDVKMRHELTTAFRILGIAGAVIIAISALVTVCGWWPVLLGDGLLPGGGIAVFLCFTVFAITLPLGVSQRIMIGLHRTRTQVLAQTVVAPFMLGSIGLIVLIGVSAGNLISVLSYVANGLVSVICLAIAAKLLAPNLGQVLRDIPKVKSVPNAPVMSLAWPQLAQMMALPIALQSDRLLLSHLTDGSELAQYNMTSQFFGMVLQAITAGGVTLWPVFAKARAEGQIRSPLKPLLWFMVIGLAAAGALGLASPLIADFLFDGQITLERWLIIGFVLFVGTQAANYPLGMYMTDARGLRFQVIPIVIMVPLNVGLSWYLIGPCGAGGPILGSAISVTLCQVLPNLIYVLRDLRHRRAAQTGGDEPDEPDGPDGPDEPSSTPPTVTESDDSSESAAPTSRR